VFLWILYRSAIICRQRGEGSGCLSGAAVRKKFTTSITGEARQTGAVDESQYYVADFATEIGLGAHALLRPNLNAREGRRLRPRRNLVNLYRSCLRLKVTRFVEGGGGGWYNSCLNTFACEIGCRSGRFDSYKTYCAHNERLGIITRVGIYTFAADRETHKNLVEKLAPGPGDLNSGACRTAAYKHVSTRCVLRIFEISHIITVRDANITHLSCFFSA